MFIKSNLKAYKINFFIILDNAIDLIPYFDQINILDINEKIFENNINDFYQNFDIKRFNEKITEFKEINKPQSSSLLNELEIKYNYTNNISTLNKE